MKMRLMDEGSVGDGLVFSRKDTECIYKDVAARARADWEYSSIGQDGIVACCGRW